MKLTDITFQRLTRSPIFWVAAGIVVAALIALYALVDPQTVHIFPPCVFKLVTGYDCPGCGSQRVLHSLLNADIPAAIHYNAYMTLFGLPLLILVFIAWLLRGRYPRFYRFFSTPPVIAILIIVTMGWFIYRNFILGPL